MMASSSSPMSAPRLMTDLLVVLPLALLSVCRVAGAWQAAEHEGPFQQQGRPLLVKYCYECHGDGASEGDLSLDRFQSVRQVLEGRAIWTKVLQKLRVEAMPPEDAEKPSTEERDFLVQWIDRTLNDIDCVKEARPGHVTLRRLNRVEYRNTIRDLLGVDYLPADDFPADDVGYGFDNIGDVLSLPPILMEKYLTAAEEITARAIAAESRRRILFVEPNDGTPRLQAARMVLKRLAGRAYRRPAAADELDRLLELVELAHGQGDDFPQSIQLALQAILVSPHFLFRVEAEPGEGESERTLNDYELATRLSYFLWSTMPDDELLEHAERGTLRDGDNLERQVLRVLKDSKSRALVDNFAAQWLQLRKFGELTPSKQHFPSFDQQLRAAMRTETEMFFAHILRDDRSILELLDADYSFMNERLAGHYGISAIQGGAFQRVSLAGTPRRGLLTQGSILTVTSNPTRTSPVKRGKWILENLLGEPPPPPPPDVPDLEEQDQKQLTGTLRQRFEQHRASPSCAVCHKEMDELGFALENFDAVGRWRLLDGKHPIDARGELPSGERFAGPRQLIEVLVEKKQNHFRRCLAEKLLTYALGRGLEYYDKCAVDKITDSLADSDDRFSTLILQIVKSEPFQKQGKKQKG